MIYIAPVAEDISRILFAIAKVESMVELQKTDMPYYCSVEFKNLVISNLHTQKFAGSYAPYSEIYQDWKLRQNLGMQYWKLYMDLVENIKVFKVRRGWMAGITPGKRATVSSSMFGKAKGTRKVLISEYARWMEFGRRGQPARPLFQPTMEEYRRDGFIKQGQKSLRRIKGGWG